MYELFIINKLFLSTTLIVILLSSFIYQQSYGIRPQYVYDNAKYITKLRFQWMQTPDTAQRVNLSNQLEATLSKIILTYEAYPELKSDSTVTRLMDELAGTENRISVSRTAYNDGVRDYNLHIRTFPNSILNMRHQRRLEILYLK